jgi:hypothetical protein
MAIKRAKSPFGYMDRETGTPRVVNPGMLLDESDPAVAAYPDHFEDVETYVANRTQQRQRNVEAATAAPGEHRTRTEPEKPARRSRSAAKKDSTEEEQAQQLGLVDPDATD